MDYLSLCLICKDENDYLAEWLDYHILMGVERFYIYDNQSQIRLCDTLRNYIDKGWAVVMDIHGKGMQLHAYEHCLATFGNQTFWMGFIDADEFLVPKTSCDLKGFLIDYEAYGGLAASSIFFGSNGHQAKPEAGQIASYTQCAHVTFQGNLLIKSIVQPARVLIPSSPHDFAYQENSWCVNENRLFVDGMKFPCHVDKIQLNHYFCRSKNEIDQKITRGWADYMSGAWPRQRFDVVNKQSTYADTTILQKLKEVLISNGVEVSDVVDTPEEAGLLEKMAALAARRSSPPLETVFISSPDLRTRITAAADLKAQTLIAEERGDYQEAARLIVLRLEAMPKKVSLLVDLSVNYLRMRNAVLAWQVLSDAWKVAPHSYLVLRGMAYYFLQIKNFEMAEKTCRLVIEMAPYNLMVLGYLTEALMGLGRGEEAIKVGLPVVELADILGELPEGMADHLVKLMADYLLEKKDYPGALRLWEARVECQPENVNVLLELGQTLLAAGDKVGAQAWLTQAKALSPKNEGGIHAQTVNINPELTDVQK